MDKIQSAIALSLLFVAGCGQILTDAPLTDPVLGEPDRSLYGHWLAKDEDSEFHIFIGKHDADKNPKSIMECAMVKWDRKMKTIGSLGGTKYFTVSRLKGTCYANVLVSADGGFSDLMEPGSYDKWLADADRRCIVIRYSVVGAELSFWSSTHEKVKKLDEDASLEFVNRKAAPARPKNGKESTDIFLIRVVNAKTLNQYLSKNGGAGLFSERSLVYTRVPE